MFLRRDKSQMPTPEDALAGRPGRAFAVPARHDVLDAPLEPPFPEGYQQAIFGLGCFWGAERKFWETPGVYTTAVGYAGGFTPNPTYQEVCSGRTGHNEVVLVVFDPAKVSYETLLRVFWRATTRPSGMPG
jgi:peptide-methionine (S)-S-oxide reductase